GGMSTWKAQWKDTGWKPALRSTAFQAVRGMVRRKPDLLREESLDGVDGGLALDGGDGFQQGNVFGADLDAVAGLGAVGDAAFVHQRVEAIVFQGGAGGMIVEEAHLADDGGADEL